LTSDFISIHAPLTAETHHLVDEEALALVKASAILINCARGALIDETALITALQDRRIAGAGLDVLETEPLSPTSPLLKIDRVILTPHTAAHTAAALQRVRKSTVENVVRVLRGQPPLNLINNSVVSR